MGFLNKLLGNKNELEMTKMQHEKEMKQMQMKYELEMQKLKNEISQKTEPQIVVMQSKPEPKPVEKPVKINVSRTTKNTYTKPDMPTEKQLRFIHEMETMLYRHYRDRKIFFAGHTKREAALYISKNLKDFRRIEQMYINR